jgi:tRNA nucleotidyltransferase (CCA-adding enzyme)
VGGFVRDLLMAQSNLDIDIVVEGDGIAFAQAFAAAENGSVKRHQQFGTAVVSLPDGYKIDVATARTEIYEHPGALPSVKPGSIKDDLRRRDFTINAMAIELNEDRFGELVDFFGGRLDTKTGSVRVLHDLSFEDDPTRIFRAIRFERRYGFIIEPHTYELIGKAVEGGFLENITRERIRNEILLILREDNPIHAICRMTHFHILEYIHSSISLSEEMAWLFDRIIAVLGWWRSIRGHADGVLLNLLILLDQLDTAETEDVLERLVLQKKYVDVLMASKTSLPAILERMNEGIMKPSEIYETLKGTPLEVLLFAMAKFPEKSDSISNYLWRLRKAKPLVNGNDLRKLHYREGPLYTQILKAAFAAQLDGLVGNKTQAIQFVKNRFPIPKPETTNFTN